MLLVFLVAITFLSWLYWHSRYGGRECTLKDRETIHLLLSHYPMNNNKIDVNGVVMVAIYHEAMDELKLKWSGLFLETDLMYLLHEL